MDNHAPSVLSASSLEGNNVGNTAGEDLGDIKDIMLDVRNGRVAYAVLDFGGFLGIGNKLFAVPFEAMTLNSVDERFILDVDKDRLKDAPGFDQDDWPNHADYRFIDDVRKFYGLETYRQEAVTV